MSRRLGIEKMREFAAKNNGECLSTEYVSNKHPIRWRCLSCGNEFDECYNRLSNRVNWCVDCGSKRPYSKERMDATASERGGKCLSGSCTSAHQRLLWECSEGHQWDALAYQVVSGSWCVKCAGLEKGTIEEMQEIAAEMGGECVSDVYVNSSTKLLWRCDKGHEWYARPRDVKHKQSWCLQCAEDSWRDTIENMQKMAEERGGECLSTEYVNLATPLQWRCSEGHTWMAAPLDIRHHDTWCPQCANRVTGASEEVFRGIIERELSAQFPNVWLDWLVSDKGYRLSLDGYNEDMQIAFEFQGVQHFKVVDWFERENSNLARRMILDDIKRFTCRDKGILLLEPNYLMSENDMVELVRGAVA